MAVTADPRRPVTFAALVVATFLVARFLSVGIHEVLGHGAFSLGLGGWFYGTYVSPVTGFAYVFLPADASPAAGALLAFSGILVEILVGLVVLWAYPRLRTFVSRLFALSLVEVLLVYSLAYLGTGALAGEGDPFVAVALLDAPHLTYALLVVSFPWMFVVTFLISVEVLQLVVPDAGPGQGAGHLLLFWLLPLPIGALPNIAETLFPDLAGPMYALMVAAIVAVLVVGLRRWERKATTERAPLARPRGRIAPVAVAVLVVIPLWIGAFGLTNGTAHGVLFGEPPVEAERTWVSAQAVNLRVHLAATGDVTVEVRMKGLPTLGSPLDREVYASFETRADLAYWSDAGTVVAAGAMNRTLWNVTAAAVDTAGTTWVVSGELPNPRVVTLELAGGQNETRFLLREDNGTAEDWTLTVVDPFRVDPLLFCSGCYVDEVNLSWDGGPPAPFEFLSVTVDGGTADRLEDPARQFVRFRNPSADAAGVYTLRLRRV